jgi:hypothetical protein
MADFVIELVKLENGEITKSVGQTKYTPSGSKY